MATDERSRSRTPAAVHKEYEWEAQKANFYQAYVTDELTLKGATAFMAAIGFQASERQWERKAKQWNFTKYVPAEVRELQEKTGQNLDRNFKRWERRHKKSKSASSCSRSGSPGGLSDAAEEDHRGRRRGASTSSGGRSPIDKSRNRGNSGSKLLSPTFVRDGWKDDVFELAITQQEKQRIAANPSTDEINLKGIASPPGSHAAAHLHVMRPDPSFQDQTITQESTIPELQFELWNEQTRQLIPTQGVPFDPDPIVSDQFDPQNTYQPVSAVISPISVYGDTFAPPTGDPLGNESIGSGMIQAHDPDWDSSLMFPPPAPDTTFPSLGLNGTDMAYTETGLPIDLMQGSFTGNAASFANDAILQTQQAFQEERHDSLAGMFGNPDDPFRQAVVLELGDYTQKVLETVTSGLQQFGVHVSMLQPIIAGLKQLRHTFVGGVMTLVDEKIRIIQNLYQAEQNQTRILRQREQVLMRFLTNNGQLEEALTELNASSTRHISWAQNITHDDWQSQGSEVTG